MIFWLVLKLEISYNNILKDFDFFWRIFLEILFLHGENGPMNDFHPSLHEKSSKSS
jgi:hypothetical protein